MYMCLILYVNNAHLYMQKTAVMMHHWLFNILSMKAVRKINCSCVISCIYGIICEICQGSEYIKATLFLILPTQGSLLLNMVYINSGINVTASVQTH